MIVTDDGVNVEGKRETRREGQEEAISRSMGNPSNAKLFVKFDREMGLINRFRRASLRDEAVAQSHTSALGRVRWANVRLSIVLRQ